MNGTLIIRGGNPLKGKVTPIPNKNSILGALPLSLVANGGITFPNMPATTDVGYLLDILSIWGASIERQENNTVFIDCSETTSCEVPIEIGKRLRGVFLLAGPLLARFGKAELPLPGGCKLGVRSISTHINAFKEMGIEIDITNDSIILKKPRKPPLTSSVWLLEASVTATINVATYASSSDIEVEIIDAACEPHVCDVLNALVVMGAEIKGIGSNHLRIKGNRNIGSCVFNASPDFVDIAGFCVAAAVTKGRIEIKNANDPLFINGILRWFELFGVCIERSGKNLIVQGSENLQINRTEFPLAGHELPKFVVRPWPGFPVDVLPVMVTLATKAEGRMLFQNWMYESGFDFVRELIYLGAEIYMSDPQRIIVMESPINYKGGEVSSPGIIQGTKAIFLAALADDTKTILHGTDILKRRYPNIVECYKNLGADLR